VRRALVEPDQPLALSLAQKGKAMGADRVTAFGALAAVGFIAVLVALALVLGHLKSSYDEEVFMCGYKATEREYERPTADDYRFAPHEATHDPNYLITPNCLYYHELVFGLKRDKAQKIRDAWGW
jgi:hypothetical protein